MRRVAKIKAEYNALAVPIRTDCFVRKTSAFIVHIEFVQIQQLTRGINIRPRWFITW